MSGPFFFAWVNSSDFVWDEYGSFARNDEDAVRFEVSQSEGEFADLSIDIRNPKIGLLSATRKIWAWLSWDRAWVEGDVDHIPDIVPLFFGRLVGIPTTINKEIVTLQLTARPLDFIAQKTALAETLKVAPYYDPIWINPANLDDLDTVLEARSALWAIDRVTGLVTISDILSGEDGVHGFSAAEVPYDGVDISIGQAPLRSITIDANVNWTQASNDVIDMGSRTFQTYTGSSTISDWPKEGSSLQAGWSVETASVEDVWKVEEAFTATYSSSWSSTEEKHADGDTVSTSTSSTIPVLQGPGTPYISKQLSGEGHTGIGQASVSSNTIYVLKHLLTTNLVLRYGAERGRSEHIKFTMTANVQPLVVDAGDQEMEVLSLSSVDVGIALPDLSIPIGDVSRANFVTTARGIQSLEYLISLGRAHLLMRARCVNVTWPIKFERAIELSCRMNASIEDDRLPGGFALGKITSYSFRCDGSNGQQEGSVTIGCAIGYGNVVSPVSGTPQYCETDYVEDDYQEFVGRVYVLDGSNVGYSLPIVGNSDDGLRFPLTKDQVVVNEVWHGSIQDQEDTIIAALPFDVLVANEATPFTLDQLHANQALASKTVSEAMKTHAIWYELELLPVNSGPFTNDFNITTTMLEVPQMLNLEAS